MIIHGRSTKKMLKLTLIFVVGKNFSSLYFHLAPGHAAEYWKEHHQDRPSCLGELNVKISQGFSKNTSFDSSVSKIQSNSHQTSYVSHELGGICREICSWWNRANWKLTFLIFIKSNSSLLLDISFVIICQHFLQILKIRFKMFPTG